MGRTLGAMHRASKTLTAEGLRFARKDWRDSRLLNEDMDRYLPAGCKNFRAAVGELIQEISGFSVDKEGYGLVHADFSFNNLFLGDGRLTVFDFDNCEYAFFAQDIGTTIYSSVFSYHANAQRNADLIGFSNEFWDSFVEGYTVENSLVSEWRQQIKLSLILREAVIYTHYHRVCDMSSMPEGFQKGVDEMRQNVEARRPAISLNFQ
jgi:Ser/Thr protein kinase RdoA (MazF antagonist)